VEERANREVEEHLAVSGEPPAVASGAKQGVATLLQAK